MGQTNLPCGIPNNLYRFFSLKEVESNSPFLKCGLYVVISFQRMHCGKEEKILINFLQTLLQPGDQGQYQQWCHFDRQYVCGSTFDIMWWMTVACVVCLPKTHNLTPVMIKEKKNNRRTFYKIPSQYFSKLPRSSKTRRVRETMTAKKSLRRNHKWMQFLDGILKQKKNFIEKWKKSGKVWMSIMH